MGDAAQASGDPPPAFDPRRSEALVVDAQRGADGAMDALIRMHLEDLRGFVRLQLAPALRVRESHSDVVQSICREVLEDLHGFEYRGEGSFRAWLFTAALNKLRQKGEYHRAQRRDVYREVRPPNEEGGSVGPELYAGLCSLTPSPSQHAVAAEQAERIERAMDRLSADQREALLLSRLVGLSHREVAERTGRTESAVRSLVSRASVRLLAAIEERA